MVRVEKVPKSVRVAVAAKSSVKAGPIRRKKILFESREKYFRKNVTTKLEGGG